MAFLIEDLQAEIVEWADREFPNRTAKTALIKLAVEEIPELLNDPDNESEWADLLILVLDIMHLKGIDPAVAIREKMSINRRRKWRVDPDTGISHHVNGDGT